MREEWGLKDQQRQEEIVRLRQEINAKHTEISTQQIKNRSQQKGIRGGQ